MKEVKVKKVKEVKEVKGADVKRMGVYLPPARVQPIWPALRSHGALFFMAFTSFMLFMPPLGGHDIPADVLVQMLVKPEGNRLRVLVRVPLGSMRDVNFPQRSPAGDLDFARARPLLRDAATLWLANGLAIYDGQTRLAPPALVASQISLPSDRSFMDFESAVAHVTGPPLPEDTTLPWNQALFDVMYDYSIGSPQAELSVHSELARLGIRTVTVLRFYTPDGAVRPFEYAGDPGLIRLDPRWHQSALRFVKLGFEHILDGIDHLLFLLCLVIPFRRIGQLVLIVTSFTVAHSITLIASAFGVGPTALWFPPLIETLIAMSIVYMALENIVLMFGSNGSQPRVLNVHRRWMITFAFGLVHGFGFSFALRETLQFAGSHLLTSLLSFNLGVELGQLLVLGLMVPLLVVLFRFVVSERIGAIILSALIAHTAWHWMTERGGQLGAYEWPTLDAAFFAAAIRWTMLVVGLAAIVWLVRGALRPRVSFLEEQSNKETRGS
ncbi:MAG TPA: HupE/UreJ family protein [Vicinamibacterales bacterium]|nr:HupE/UreJ family protein [Vicinamibacterales bacterium]